MTNTTTLTAPCELPGQCLTAGVFAEDSYYGREARKTGLEPQGGTQFIAPAGTELYLIHAPEHPMKAVRDGLAQVVAVGGYTFTVLAADLAEATR